jgi:hypothetical protein
MKQTTTGSVFVPVLTVPDHPHDMKAMWISQIDDEQIWI